MAEAPTRKRRRPLNSSPSIAVSKSTSAKDLKQDEKIKYLMRQVRNLKPELKQTSKSVSINPNYNGSLISLLEANVIQGTSDSSQRVGDTIELVDVYGHFHFGTSNTGGGANVRMIVIQDYANDQSLQNDILVNVGTTGAFDSLYTFDNYRKKWKVLADKRIAAGSATHPDGIISFYHKFNGTKTRFDAATSTVMKNEIRILFVTDDATTNQVTVIGNTRVRYTDV